MVDTYFGQELPDPYRWMEREGPDLREWLLAQGNAAQAYLVGLPLAQFYTGTQILTAMGEVIAVQLSTGVLEIPALRITVAAGAVTTVDIRVRIPERAAQVRRGQRWRPKKRPL